MVNKFAVQYLGSWLRRTFSGPWPLAMLTASVLGIVVNYAADRFPELQVVASRAAWQLPLVLFLVTLVPAAVYASWKPYEEALKQLVQLADETQSLRDRLASRVAYEQLATALAGFHREASEGWINRAPTTDQALAESWRPMTQPWFSKEKGVLELYGVSRADMNHFEVVNNLDIEKFNNGIPAEVRRMWVRVERLADLAKKYENLARK